MERQPGDDTPAVEGEILENVTADVAPSKQRKPYHKPEFVCEAVFETMALSCGKMTSTQQQCRGNARSS